MTCATVVSWQYPTFWLDYFQSLDVLMLPTRSRAFSKGSTSHYGVSPLWGVKLWLFMHVCGGARVVQLFSIDTESLNVETAAGPQFPCKPRQGEGKLPILIGSLSAV